MREYLVAMRESDKNNVMEEGFVKAHGLRILFLTVKV